MSVRVRNTRNRWRPRVIPPPLPAIRYVGAVSVNGGLANSQASPTITGLEAGDVLVVVTTMSNARTQTVSSAGVTFTAIQNTANGHLSAWVGAVPDTSDRTVSDSWPSSTAACFMAVLVFRGATSGLDVAKVFTDTIAAANAFTITGITTATPGALAFAMIQTFDTNPLALSGTGWVSRLQSAGGSRSHGIATKEMPAAGATGDATWTLSSQGPDGAATLTFAIAAAI